MQSLQFIIHINDPSVIGGIRYIERYYVEVFIHLLKFPQIYAQIG